MSIFTAAVVASALISSTASAADFHSTAGSTKASGAQQTVNKLSTTAGEVTCQHATFSGTFTSSTVSSIEVTPSYEGCHIIFFGSTISASINHNGCKFKANSTGTADLVCPAEKSITLAGAGCTVSIGSQTGLKSLSFENSGSGINVTVNLSDIKYSHAGFTCGTGSGTTGTYTGTVAAVGQDTSAKIATISYS